MLGLAVIVALAGVGYYIWHKAYNAKTSNPSATSHQEAKYISFGGGYLFSIPAGYSIDETAITGVTIIYPDSSPITSGKRLDQLYANGSVAVQPITALKDNNTQAFKDYVNDKLVPELRKSMSSGSDVRLAKQGDVVAIKVLAVLNNGKRLRAIYALNLSQPIIMVAKDESDVLKIVGSTMEDLTKTKLKSGIDQVAQVVKQVVEQIQNQDVEAVRKASSDEFNKSETKEQLTAKLKKASAYLDRSITIVGGSYNGKVFIAQLTFEPKPGEPPVAGGVVSLHKVGQTWKLDALQLPQ